MIYYHKMTGVKKLFLLHVFLLAMCATKNSYASQTDVLKMFACHVPSIVLCGAKLMLPSTATTFFESTQIADCITYGPGVVPQLMMMGCNLGIGCWLLINKKNLPNQPKKPTNDDLTKRQKFTGIIFFSGLGELVLCVLLQSGFLLYQKKLTRKSVAYASIYSLINVIPPFLFVFNKKYEPEKNI
jgi:hypothetical protein